MNRADFCRRMMPALRLAAKQGYIRNDVRTRGLLAYDLGLNGSKHLSNRLCSYARDGLLLSSAAGGLRRIYRLSTRGRLALGSNAQHAQRNTVSARLEDYLAANPDEELMRDDVAAKFCCSKQQARRAIEYVVGKGAAECVRVVRVVRRPRELERRAA